MAYNVKGHRRGAGGNTYVKPENMQRRTLCEHTKHSVAGANIQGIERREATRTTGKQDYRADEQMSRGSN